MNEIHPERVAARLTVLREALGLSRSEFSDSIGVDRSSYTKIEDATGKPLHQFMAFDIATRWGVSMDYIYRGHTSDRDLPSNLANTIRASLIGQNR